MSIHAYAALAKGKNLTPFDYPEPSLGSYDVCIQISHCGLCHSDIHLIDNDWNTTVYPLVAGHEIVGTIQKMGSSVQSFSIGERVGISWQKSSCLTCGLCLEGQENVCLQKKITCIGSFGGFADRIITDSRFVYTIPEELSSKDAAPLLCAGATVFAPLIRWKIEADSAVGVIGIGGLGHLFLQFAKAFGCEVYAISGSEAKKEEARSFGADHFMLLNDATLWKTGANKLDFLLCTASVDLDWSLVLSLLKPNGILCFVGKPPAGVSVPAGLLTSGQKIITGSTVASRKVLSDMLRFAARHHIYPKTELLPMKEINAAIQRLRQNKARYRIVLENTLDIS